MHLEEDLIELDLEPGGDPISYEVEAGSWSLIQLGDRQIFVPNKLMQVPPQLRSTEAPSAERVLLSNLCEEERKKIVAEVLRLLAA